MSMLACTNKIIFIIRHVIILLSLIAFLSHCMYRISTLFLRYLFCLMSCYIIFFCLMQFRTANYILCIMTENLLWLICAFLLSAVSQLLFYFSCFFVFSILIIIIMFLLNSFLTVSIFLTYSDFSSC